MQWAGIRGASDSHEKSVRPSEASDFQTAGLSEWGQESVKFTPEGLKCLTPLRNWLFDEPLEGHSAFANMLLCRHFGDFAAFVGMCANHVLFCCYVGVCRREENLEFRPRVHGLVFNIAGVQGLSRGYQGRRAVMVPWRLGIFDTNPETPQKSAMKSVGVKKGALLPPRFTVGFCSHRPQVVMERSYDHCDLSACFRGVDAPPQSECPFLGPESLSGVCVQELPFSQARDLRFVYPLNPG